MAPQGGTMKDGTHDRQRKKNSIASIRNLLSKKEGYSSWA